MPGWGGGGGGGGGGRVQIAMNESAPDARRETLAVLRKARSADAIRAALEALPPADPAVREAIVARHQQIAPPPRRRGADCALRTPPPRGLRTCAAAPHRDPPGRAPRTCGHGP